MSHFLKNTLSHVKPAVRRSSAENPCKRPVLIISYTIFFLNEEDRAFSIDKSEKESIFMEMAESGNAIDKLTKTPDAVNEVRTGCYHQINSDAIGKFEPESIPVIAKNDDVVINVDDMTSTNDEIKSKNSCLEVRSKLEKTNYDDNKIKASVRRKSRRA